MIPTPILQMVIYLVKEVISFWLSLTASSSIPLDFSSKSVEELDRLRDALLPVRIGYSHCLLITTIIVTIGVIFEIFEIGIDTRNNLRRLKGSEEIPERKLHSALKLLGTIGWLLIVFGLVGEYFAEADINSADSNIEAVNDSILEKTQSAANNAQVSAGKAETAASSAQGSANKAKADAESADEEAEEERLKREKLEAELSWRELTPEQSDAMMHVLESSPGSGVIIGITSPDEPEKRQYAMSMLSPFSGAKWNVVRLQIGGLALPGSLGQPPIGVSVWCGGKQCSSSSATLHNALCAAGIHAVDVYDPSFGPDVILVIGDILPPKEQDSLEHVSTGCEILAKPQPFPEWHP
jgi:hypothetical protein